MINENSYIKEIFINLGDEGKKILDTPPTSYYPDGFYSNLDYEELEKEKEQIEKIITKDNNEVLLMQMELISNINKSIQNFKTNLLDYDTQLVEDISNYFYNLESTLKGISSKEISNDLNKLIKNNDRLLEKNKNFIGSVLDFLTKILDEKLKIGADYNEKIEIVNDKIRESQEKYRENSAKEEYRYKSVINTIYQTLEQVNTDPETFKSSLKITNDESERYLLKQIDVLKQNFQETKNLTLEKIDNAYEKIKMDLYSQNSEKIEEDLKFNDEKDQMLKSIKHQILDAEKKNNDALIKKLLKDFDKIENTKLIPISDELDKQAEKENLKFKQDALFELQNENIKVLTKINEIRSKIANLPIDLKEQIALGFNNQDYLQVHKQKEISEKTIAYLINAENNELEFNKEILSYEKEKNLLLLQKEFAFKEIDVKLQKELNVLYNSLLKEDIKRKLEFNILTIKGEISPLKQTQYLNDFSYGVQNKLNSDAYNRQKFSIDKFENILFKSRRKVEIVKENRFENAISTIDKEYQLSIIQAKQNFLNDVSDTSQTKLNYYQTVFTNKTLLEYLSKEGNKLYGINSRETDLEKQLTFFYTELENRQAVIKGEFSQQKEQINSELNNKIDILNEKINVLSQEYENVVLDLDTKLSDRLLFLDSYIYDLPNELDKEKKKIENIFLLNLSKIRKEINENIESTNELQLFTDETINNSAIAKDSKLLSEQKSFNKTREQTIQQLNKNLQKEISDLDKIYKNMY